MWRTGPELPPGGDLRACRRARKIVPLHGRCWRPRAGTGRARLTMAAAVTPMAASSFWPTISRWLPPCRRKRAEERVRCDHDRPPARRRREVFGAGVGAGFGSRGGDSVRTDWTKDGPAGPDAIGSPWALTGRDSGVGTALHGTPP